MDPHDGLGNLFCRCCILLGTILTFGFPLIRPHSQLHFNLVKFLREFWAKYGVSAFASFYSSDHNPEPLLSVKCPHFDVSRKVVNKFLI